MYPFANSQWEEAPHRIAKKKRGKEANKALIMAIGTALFLRNDIEMRDLKNEG